MIYQILKQVAETDSTKQKEAILAFNKSELLARIFRMTYSKRITYGIAKVPESSAGLGVYTLDQALDIMETKFATREVTGNAAIQLLNDICNSVCQDDFEVIKRIIKRDLDCGASIAIANKIWAGIIPEQPQYLAAAFSQKNLENIVYPAYAQLKADGSRCFAEIDEDGHVTLSSRGGNNYLGLFKIINDLKAMGVRNVVVDGELIHVPKPTKFDIFALDEADIDEDIALANDEQESDRNKSNGLANKSLANSLSEQEADEMVFNVWDIVDLDVYWSRKESTVPYEQRFAQLGALVKDRSTLRLIENTEVNNLQEALDLYRSYIEQNREGIILKNKHGLWKDARTTDQIKFKEEIEFDVEIIDVYPHRKNPNKLGGIIVRDKTTHVQFRCGSGFKDTTHKKVKGVAKKVLIPLEERHEYDRELLMTKASELIGMIAQIKCNGLQRSKGRLKGEPGEFKVFLPIFQLIRRDKTVPNDYRDVFEHIPK